MTKQEMVSGAYVEFQKAVLGSLPRDISDELALDWAGNGEKLTQVLRTALISNEATEQTELVPLYPADDEVFELSIEPFTGLEMVRDDGFDNWHKWQFNGKEITERETKRFKLVPVGYQPNFDAVKEKLAKHGTIPQGQWRKAFKKAYPKPDGKGPVGVADASWVNPSGGVGFPCVRGGGDEYFPWTGNGFLRSSAWLVEVK